MAFKKGDPRPAGAGRKKGTPNLKKLLRVEQVLAELNVNPVLEILRLIPDLDPDMAIKSWFEILKYIEPQKKAIEVSEESLPRSEDYSALTDAQVIEVLSLPKPEE